MDYSPFVIGISNIHTRISFCPRYTIKEVIRMLRWAVIFLVIALVAALFGFTGIAATAAGIAKFLFFLFLALCLILFIIGMSVGRKVM
jgi:uncharacterized membrane protein YtjA (UPF0391 family)